MHTVNVSHADILNGANTFAFLTSRTGMTAAKIAKLRIALVAEAKPSAEGYDVVAKQFATMTTAPEDATEEQRAAFIPEPVIVRAAAPPASKTTDPKAPAALGEKQVYELTRTPAYVMTDASLTAFEKARDEFLKGEVELSVPELTEADINGLLYALPDGREIAIPGRVMDVLVRFGPAL